VDDDGLKEVERLLRIAIVNSHQPMLKVGCFVTSSLTITIHAMFVHVCVEQESETEAGQSARDLLGLLLCQQKREKVSSAHHYRLTTLAILTLCLCLCLLGMHVGGS
jgi:hypothetical protein